MREYLFRGRRIDNKEWVEGNYVGDYDGTHYITQPLKNAHRLVPVDPATIGQYTGLNDKNCKRIFEGDVILHHDDIKSYVIYNSAHCAYLLIDINGDRNKCQCDKLGSCSSMWVEVIGTIHDKEVSA